MTLYSNQFALTANKGSITQAGIKNVINGIVASTQAVDLTPGQPVKIADVASPIPQFVLAGPNDPIFGFVTFNLKDQSYPAYSAVEIATKGTVMIMQASAAIAGGAKVEAVTSGVKVKTFAGVNTIAGIALTKATNADDLIQVMIETPSLNEAITLESVLAINPTGSGTAGQVLKVDNAGTALTFGDLSLTDLSDGPPALGTNGQSLKMQGTTGTVFAT